ncbi:MAG: bifunctional folylpolyglutamate synthase/dihydrofolate synthase, partial [Candidatus Binatia bacterium]
LSFRVNMPSYPETLNYIFNLRGGEIDLRLHRMAEALSLFDHPERSYRAFHIAGTNGKGSTAAMLHRILSAQGYLVGLYTSPHVVSFTERIRVGDWEIAPEEVVELAQAIRVRSLEAGISLTFFEFVTVMALVYFARCRVDLAVVEVGLGGRLDATNLVAPGVSIITTISKDHEAYLGSNLDSIAREKGGIIKAGIPVICGYLPPDATVLLQRMAAAKGSASYFLGRDFSIASREDGLFDYEGLWWDLTDLFIALRGEHQRHNAAVALAALEVTQAEVPVSATAVREGLETVFWPARFEVVLHHPTVILDGAHNSQGIEALVKEVGIFLGGKRVKLLFGAMKDKDWSSMLQGLSKVSAEVILTRIPMDRSADPNNLRSAISADIPVAVIDDPLEAITALIRKADDEQAILATGSLYLLGRIRPYLLKLRVPEALGGDVPRPVP